MLGDVRLPRLAHASDKSVRPAEQQDVRAQRMAAREHAQVLQHDRVKKRRHQLVGWRANLLQAVDVGLGEYAALPRHFVQLDAVISLIAELGDGNFQLGIDLVDDRAGSASALVVHRRDFFLAAGFLIVLEDDDLGVLPAEFDHRIHFGMHLLDGERNRRNFLHEFRADLVGDRSAAGAGHEHARVVAVDADFLFDAAQEFERLLRLLGFVALVVLPENLVGRRVDDGRFYRRRTHIEAHHELRVMIVRPLRR